MSEQLDRKRCKFWWHKRSINTLDYIILHGNFTSGSLWAYTVQMVVIIFIQMLQNQLSNSVSRGFFLFFYYPNRKWESWFNLVQYLSKWVKLTVLMTKDKNDLIAKELQGPRWWSEISEDQEDARSGTSLSTVGGSPYLIWCISVSHVASMRAGKVRK